MKRLQVILLTVGAIVAALLPAVALAPQAYAATPCVVTAMSWPASECGPYKSSKITLSNGYNTWVNNNGWACKTYSCGPQKLTTYDPSNWSVVSNQAARNTAVLSYPSVDLFPQNNGVSPALSSFWMIRSYYSESMPHNSGTIAQAAYDIWLDHTTGPGEVMIWVDNVNRGTGGSKVLTHHTFSKVSWTLMQYGGPGGELIWSRDTNAGTGTIHIRDMLGWLVANHYESTTTAINQLDFGWEICSTGGAPETFAVHDYTLTTKPA